MASACRLAPWCHPATSTLMVPPCRQPRCRASCGHVPCIVPFGAASNARLSLQNSTGMLLGPRSEQVHGLEPTTQAPFVALAGRLCHLGILISAGDHLAATRAMFAKRLLAGCLRLRCWARFRLSYLGRLHVAGLTPVVHIIMPPVRCHWMTCYMSWSSALVNWRHEGHDGHMPLAPRG
jgi:hypothetical protein